MAVGMRQSEGHQIDYAGSTTPAVRLDTRSFVLRVAFALVIALFGLMFLWQGFNELRYIDWLWRTGVGRTAIGRMTLGLVVIALGIGMGWRAVYRFNRDRRLP